MIDLDRPPVADRPLPDPVALRQATLLAARRVGVRPVRRGRRVALVLVAAALLAAVLVGALRSVVPTPDVAAPSPTPPASPAPSVQPLPTGAIEVDRGPATAAQIRSATQRCLHDTGQPPVEQVLYARRLFGGSGTAVGLVLRLTDQTLVSCYDLNFGILGGDGSLPLPSPDVPAVDYGSGGAAYIRDDTGTTIKTSSAFATTAEVVAIDLGVEQDDGSSQRWRGRVVDGWVLVPFQRRVDGTPRDTFDLPSTTAVGYDASGNRVPVLITSR